MNKTKIRILNTNLFNSIRVINRKIYYWNIFKTVDSFIKLNRFNYIIL